MSPLSVGSGGGHVEEREGGRGGGKECKSDSKVASRVGSWRRGRVGAGIE